MKKRPTNENELGLPKNCEGSIHKGRVLHGQLGLTQARLKIQTIIAKGGITGKIRIWCRVGIKGRVGAVSAAGVIVGQGLLPKIKTESWLGVRSGVRLGVRLRVRVNIGTKVRVSVYYIFK